MFSTKDFKKKFGIVTGAASGIGLATAKLIAERGAGIAIVDLNLKQAQQVEEEIKKIGGYALAIQADVSKEMEVARMVQQTLSAFGSIDFLVNNAGIFRVTTILDLEPAEWDQVIAVNLRGPYLCCRAVIPHMLAQKKGVIVNVSSQAGRSTSRFGGAHYTTSKAGLLGLTRHLALEMAPHGIRVNAFCPGLTFTPMATKILTPEKLAESSANIPLRRFAQPEEHASGIAFLLSDESSFITGASIDSNGGVFML
jgi:3-oxoacyl-[acyl-carrier protein] reductase